VAGVEQAGSAAGESGGRGKHARRGVCGLIERRKTGGPVLVLVVESAIDEIAQVAPAFAERSRARGGRRNRERISRPPSGEETGVVGMGRRWRGGGGKRQVARRGEPDSGDGGFGGRIADW